MSEATEQPDCTPPRLRNSAVPTEIGQRIVAKVVRVGDVSERPILHALQGGRQFVPRGWVPVWVGEDCYRACFAGPHLSTVTAPQGTLNVLPQIVFGWFPADAGRPGTSYLVAVEADARGRWVLKPWSV